MVVDFFPKCCFFFLSVTVRIGQNLLNEVPLASSILTNFANYSYTYAKRPRYFKCGLNVKRNCKNAIGPVAQKFHLPNHVMLFEVFNRAYRSFSHDVTPAILVFQNNKTAVMLVSQTNPVGVQLFSYVNTLLFQ